MLHAAGILLGSLWLYTCLHQQTGEKAVLLISSFGNLSAHIGQVQEIVAVHRQKTSIPQGRHRMAHAGL